MAKPLYIDLNEIENKMLINQIKIYGYRSKAEYIRDLIKRIHTGEGEIRLIPINTQPFM